MDETTNNATPEARRLGALKLASSVERLEAVIATASARPARKPAARKDWKCQECGKRFTLRGAERASSEGCSCGGTDIDLVTD